MLAALASLSAAAIHFSAAGEHDGLFAAGFLAMGVFQAAWAALVTLRPHPLAMWLGIAGNAAIVAIWAIAHTAGLPFGPGAGTGEATGLKDLTATGFELIAIAAAFLMLHGSLSTRVGALRIPATGSVLTAAATAALTGVALATPHAHRPGEHHDGAVVTAKHRGGDVKHGGGGMPLAGAGWPDRHEQDGRHPQSRSKGDGHGAGHRTASAHTNTGGHGHVATVAAVHPHGQGGGGSRGHSGSGDHRNDARHDATKGGPDHGGHHGAPSQPPAQPDQGGGQPEGEPGQGGLPLDLGDVLPPVP